MAFDRDGFHRDAVQIPSHQDVTAMREFLVETLDDEGYDPEVDAVGNVIATRGDPGSTGTHLVLNTHLDTVPPHVPYERDGEIVRGRGACDAKGSLAAMLDAFVSTPLETGGLTLAITPDEETAQFGGSHLGDTLSADGYIVGEPTGLDVCPAARGNFGGHVMIEGERAHASEPDSGTNPLRAVGTVVAALEDYDEACGPAEHPFLGSATIAPTRIESGGPLNQIPAACTVSFDRRTVPPETIEEFVPSLTSYLERRLPSEFVIDVRAAYPESPDPDAFVTDPETALVQTLATVSGGDIRPFDAATDASHVAKTAPTVVFGPGRLADEVGPVAHAEREFIDTGEITDASRILRTTLERVLH